MMRKDFWDIGTSKDKSGFLSWASTVIREKYNDAKTRREPILTQLREAQEEVARLEKELAESDKVYEHIKKLDEDCIGAYWLSTKEDSHGRDS
jgi:hypothetical protein